MLFESRGEWDRPEERLKVGQRAIGSLVAVLLLEVSQLVLNYLCRSTSNPASQPTSPDSDSDIQYMRLDI